MPIAKQRAIVSTIFFWCNDVAAMRHFYTNLIGLEEIYAGDEAISYKLGPLQMFFLKAKNTVPEQLEWAVQPAFTWERQEGTAFVPSWVVEVPPSAFETTLQRMESDGVKPYTDPVVREDGHKQFFVMDPMGHTVEIYSAPETD